MTGSYLEDGADGGAADQPLPLLPPLPGRQVRRSVAGTFGDTEQSNVTDPGSETRGSLLQDPTWGPLGTGSEDQVDRHGRVVQVLIQGPAQHAHVLLQVAPEEAGHVTGSGVDHVAHALSGQKKPVRPPQVTTSGHAPGVSPLHSWRLPEAWQGA